jgi:hypothetical protein
MAHGLWRMAPEMGKTHSNALLRDALLRDAQAAYPGEL